MAPHTKKRDDEPEYPQTSTLIDDDDELPTPTGKPLVVKPYPMATSIIIGSVIDVSSADNPWAGRPNYPPFTGRPTGPPPWAAVDSTVYATSTEWITTTKATPLGDGVKSSHVTTSPFPVSTVSEAPHPYTSYGYGHGGPGWHGAKEKMYTGRTVAAAIITPVLSLTLIGAIVFFCMRKRKRQRQDVAGTSKSLEEMKTQTQPLPTAQPYMARAPAVAPSYAASASNLMPLPSLSAPPPIILGPIPSGPNGTYGTGIDTSDVISMTSANNLRPGPPNPFSDNDSLAEPPPPYRPRSAAPPSLTNSSRQSSFRASVAPPTTSRTHLIERSPFEDPEDGDAVSELSGPTAGQSEDAMSAVSDLSYQNDPVMNRSSV